MQGNLNKKYSFFLKKRIKKVFLGLIYFGCSFFQRMKKSFAFKRLFLVMVVIIFAIFSQQKIKEMNSPFSGILDRIASSNQKITIENKLPNTFEINNLEKNNKEFTIAAWREDKNDIMDLSDDSEISLILGSSALVTPKKTFDLDSLPKLTRTEIKTYTVQPGDTISTIAENFELKWSTILWENNLNYWSVIKPGNNLTILPVDGLTHQVKSGENLSYLANKYKSSIEKIIQINNLSENGELKPGDKIIIPDGTPPPAPKPTPTYVPVTPQIVQESYSDYWDWRANTNCHLFVARQCTDWSAFKWAADQGQCVPSWGNAKSWFGNAKRDGYQTGTEPRQGAIMSLTCTSWVCGYYGHVAYVEDFDENSVTISEMNGLKRREYSTRTFKNITGKWQGGWKIIGYIYPH